jgi:hypothetical protein
MGQLITLYQDSYDEMNYSIHNPRNLFLLLTLFMNLVLPLCTSKGEPSGKQTVSSLGKVPLSK